MAQYYGTAIVPTRVRHPKDKSLAEGTVKFASTWITAKLRNEKFFSVAEVQRAVKEQLENLNNRPFQKRPGSRRSAYLEEEKEFVLPLPTAPYALYDATKYVCHITANAGIFHFYALLAFLRMILL